MCRLAAFPPGTSPDQAHEIVSKFVKNNKDGVGSCYVEKGEFKLNKFPYSYEQALSKKDNLFDHMPYDGWTLAHVRLATHGGNEYKNTHPIIKGNYAVVHNGVFSDSRIVKFALADSVKWSGDTDTEVAAYLLNKYGPSDFYKGMPSYAGVYVALHRDGSLVAVKLSGDLEVLRNENDTLVLASEFPFGKGYWEKSMEASQGIMKFDKEGHATNFKFEKKRGYSYNQGTQSSTYGRGSYQGRGTDDCENYCTRDIGFPAGGIPPTHTSGSAAASTNDTQAAKGNNSVIGGKKKRVMDLWTWFSQEELDHSEEMME